MPTIQQLPPATQASGADELPISQNGVTRSVSVGDLLAGTQPVVSLGTGQLLGRVSLGPGGPEPVTLGTGVAVAESALVATGADHSGFAIAAVLLDTDQVVLNHAGSPMLLPLASLRGLFTAGVNVTIDRFGVISFDGSAGSSTSTPTLDGATLSVAFPTSPTGLIAGTLWNNQGVLCVVSDPSAVGS